MTKPWVAKVKETGEVYDIKIKTVPVEVHISFDDSNNINLSEIVTNDDDSKVILSNGKTYDRHQVLIGTDEIRDNSIKNILQDGNEYS